MTYNVFGGTLNLAQSNPIPYSKVWGLVAMVVAPMLG